MKKAAASLLLVFFLFSALVPAHVKEELAELPELLVHFAGHKTETPGLTFSQFHKMHYGEDFAQHESDHDHSDLPMKHQCEHIHTPALALLTTVSATLLQLPERTMGNRPVLHGQSYSFSLPHDIWQPPRAV